MVHALQAAVRKTKLEVNVAYPCEVTKFDPTTQLVEVRVDFSHVLSNDDSEVTLEPEILVNMLVSFEGQARVGGGYLTFPIAAGDKGYVTVFDRSVERWTTRGEGGDPQFRHTHSRVDGVFKPVRDVSRAIPNFDGAAAVLEHSCIKLGMGADEAAVLGDILRSYLGDLKSYIDLHIHMAPSGVTGPPIALDPPNPPAPAPSPLIPNFLSGKVKIDD